MTNFNMFQIVWVLLVQLPGGILIGWWAADYHVPTLVFVSVLISFSGLSAMAPFLISSMAPDLFKQR